MMRLNNKIIYVLIFIASFTCLKAKDKGLYDFKPDKSIPDTIKVLSRKVNSNVNKKNWADLLLLCNPVIKQKARKFSSVKLFFKTNFPNEIYEGTKLNISISVKRIKSKHNLIEKAFAFSFYPTGREVLMWEIKVINIDSKLYLDFPLRGSGGEAETRTGSHSRYQ
jgi:hypothetical protein